MKSITDKNGFGISVIITSVTLYLNIIFYLYALIVYTNKL